jgi:hypothetical protein
MGAIDDNASLSDRIGLTQDALKRTEREQDACFKNTCTYKPLRSSKHVLFEKHLVCLATCSSENKAWFV